MLSRAGDQVVLILRAVLQTHRQTLKLLLVVLWVIGAVLALIVAGFLLGGELIRYGFRDRPPPG